MFCVMVLNGIDLMLNDSVTRSAFTVASPRDVTKAIYTRPKRGNRKVCVIVWLVPFGIVSTGRRCLCLKQIDSFGCAVL